MLQILALHALLALAAPSPPLDTILAVSRGARLDLQPGPQAGGVQVRAWDRDEVRVVTPANVSVTTAGNLVRVGAGQPGNRQGTWEVSVPRWMPVSVSTNSGSVVIEDVAAEIAVEAVQGSVRIRGGEGRVSARSIQGGVTVENARGRVEASSMNAGVRLIGVVGEVQVETVNGSVTLQRVDSNDLVVSTTNGSVEVDGPIRSGGRYRITSHNGRVRMTVQEGASATFTVATYNGRYNASFPIQVTTMGADRRLTFVTGGGSARVEVTSFNGNIDFRRPGEP